MFRSKASEAENFQVSYDTAFNFASDYQQVRINAMSSSGAQAQKLALIGHLVSDPANALEEVISKSEYAFQDSILTGSDFVFGLLERVIIPASKKYGPSGFAISSWDETVDTIESYKSSSVSVPAMPQTLRTYSLGSTREDYWRTGAFGIANDVAKMNVGIKQSKKLSARIASDVSTSNFAVAANKGLDIIAEKAEELLLSHSGNIALSLSQVVVIPINEILF